ncbi:MAG: hypothetical protein HOY71_18985, partial [Nonomuraea sp.]|nr:hypothetical protein [Nonomuraea sp.]
MTTSTTLPPAAPHVVAAAVESLTSRLRKKLDAAVEQYAALDRVPDGTDLVITCGPDAVVTLAPGPSGTITDESQARCTCLLSPRCLHRAALLTACPLPDLEDTPQDPTTPSAAPLPQAASREDQEAESPEATQGVAASGVAPRAGQVEAAEGLWRAAAAVLVAGVPGAGAVPQAELLRA